ncbi:unnamed protein product [Caenorhabditis auriculariae]|uniref:Inosine/uridine-preferring nucleoside hydrolase domain-containing protein n=1 Tax=Caenorhabditis auriculariae TaxID=2777116 RepID=A0A8S1GT56_9PELO|nr:unnamed protein product [Caenorhabditis auriculariae]
MPRKLIIDTDGVSDDVRAISLALQHPDVEVVAITTVHGCVPVKQATANVNRTIRANGIQGSIPVYEGASRSLLNLQKDTTVSDFFGKDGVGDRPTEFPESDSDDYKASGDGIAALALIRLVQEHPDATLVCIGPLTNLALALQLEENFAAAPQKVVIMGGNYYGVGNVSGVSSAEYNFHGDPEAADIVLRELKCPVTVVPWEAFFFRSMEENEVDFHAHLRYDTPLANFLSTATRVGRIRFEAVGRQYAYCDEIAIATAINEERVVLESKSLVVAVELSGTITRGQVVVDWVEQMWAAPGEVKPLDEEPRRRINFVTVYNVTLVDKWMHAVTSGSGHFD